MFRVRLNIGKRLLGTSQCVNVHLSQQQRYSREGQSEGAKEETVSESTPVTNAIKKEDDKQGLTPDDPFVVASPTSKCIVGCSCEPESHAINWFYVTEGEPQTCSCGYYFKLDKVDATSTWVPEYSRIMYVDDRRVDPRLQKREGILQKLFSKGKRNAIPPSSMNSNASKNKVEP